jgi:tetratricopeptide (TPR) repeat protein
LRYRPTPTPEDAVLQFVYQMEDVPFTRPGIHSLSLRVDEAEIAGLSFDVRVTGIQNESLEIVTNLLLQDGVSAFSAGENEIAEKIFKQVVEAKPGSGTALNNLAFVHLSQGKAVEALAEFLGASTLELETPELLDANIACCHYVLGEFQRALDLFVRCIDARLFRSPAVLFGIEDSGLFPVQLISASNYLGLMLLNAAWSALKNGAPELAFDYARRAGEFPVAPAPDQEARFAHSLNEVISHSRS